jgi:hypothetical protein
MPMHQKSERIIIARKILGYQFLIGFIHGTYIIRGQRVKECKRYRQYIIFTGEETACNFTKMCQYKREGFEF